MKRALPRALRGAGWMLMAAGTLGMSNVAVAQAPTASPRGLPAAVRGKEPSAWLSENYGRLAEMRVELAWLADAETFPCRLSAKVSGLALEVRGSVPSDAVRQQALRLAREETGLEIVDALRVLPRLDRRTVNRPSETLQRDAQRAVQDTFPQYGRTLGVQVQGNGLVTVIGTVSSYEEKLAVSQRLGRVSGCNRVVNSLRVQPLQKEGRLYTRVTANGKLLVPSEDVSPEPTPMATQVSRMPADEAKPQPVQPVGYTPPLDSPSGTAEAIVPPIGDKESVAAPAPSGTAFVPTAVPPKPSLAFVRPAAGKAPATPPAPQEQAPPSPMHYYQTQWRRPETTALSARKVTPTASVQAEVSAASSASVEAAATATEMPYVTTGVVLVEAVEPPPKPAAPSPAPTIAPVSEQPIITTGVILIECPDPEQPPPPAPAPGRDPIAARLKQRIEAICGSAARNVEVLLRSPTCVQVYFTARSDKEGEQLSTRIFQLPELAPYEVSMEIQVVP